MRWRDIPRDPSRSTLRQFAGLCLAIFGTFACLNYSRGTHLTAVVWAGLAGVGAVGLAWPRLMRPIFVGWLVLVFPVGWVVSRVLLTAIYFAVFTPMGLWFRLRGRDALGLARPGRGSLWVRRGPPAGPASYYRQFCTEGRADDGR